MSSSAGDSTPQDGQAAANMPDLKQQIKASYDLMAPTYNEWTRSHSPLRLKYLEKLFHHCKLSDSPSAAPSILELGCGAGLPILDTILGRYPNATITANDLSTTQIELARKNLDEYSARATLIDGDMNALSFPDAAFDAIIALYSIVHLPLEEQAAMLHKLLAWLKPGGCVLATFNTDADPGVVDKGWLHEKAWMYWSGFGAEATMKKLRALGFEVLEERIDGGDDEKFLWVLLKKHDAAGRKVGAPVAAGVGTSLESGG